MNNNNYNDAAQIQYELLHVRDGIRHCSTGKLSHELIVSEFRLSTAILGAMGEKVNPTEIMRLVISGFKALVDAVTTWNNEEKRQFVCEFIKEQASQYNGFRRLRKVLIDLIPTKAFAGSPI